MKVRTLFSVVQSIGISWLFAFAGSDASTVGSDDGENLRAESSATLSLQEVADTRWYRPNDGGGYDYLHFYENGYYEIDDVGPLPLIIGRYEQVGDTITGRVYGGAVGEGLLQFQVAKKLDGDVSSLELNETFRIAADRLIHSMNRGGRETEFFRASGTAGVGTDIWMRYVDPEQKKPFAFSYYLNAKRTALEHPHRAPYSAYMRWHEERDRWVFEITDGDGEFPEPREILLPKSKVPGSYIGGDDDKVYTFTGKGSKFELFSATPNTKAEWHVLRESDPPQGITYTLK